MGKVGERSAREGRRSEGCSDIADRGIRWASFSQDGRALLRNQMGAPLSPLSRVVVVGRCYG